MKAAKKEKKELDEDELAHQAKLRAGMAFDTLFTKSVTNFH